MVEAQNKAKQTKPDPGIILIDNIIEIEIKPSRTGWHALGEYNGRKREICYISKLNVMQDKLEKKIIPAAIKQELRSYLKLKHNIYSNSYFEPIWEDFLQKFKQSIKQIDLLEEGDEVNEFVQMCKYMKDRDAAEQIIETFHIYAPVEYKEKILLYKNGAYKKASEKYLDSRILNYLIAHGRDYKIRKRINNIKTYIKKHRICSLTEFDRDPYLINCKNIIIDIRDPLHLAFKQHFPHRKLMRQIPWEFNEHAYPERSLQFLREVFHETDLRLIAELMGLTLTSIMKFQRAVLMYGEGANGKTAFGSLLTSLVGKKNRSSIDLIQFKEKFEMAPIAHKLLNMETDMDTENRIPIKEVKSYVGNEAALQINAKYIHPYEIKPTAKLWYGCNDDFPNIPSNADKGFFRKWVPIEFPNVFEEEDRDRDIVEKITAKKEMEGMLNLAILGLRQLLHRGHLDYYMTWEDVKDLWHLRTNPIRRFIDENGEVGEYKSAREDPNNEFWVIKDVFVDEFNKWRKIKGKKPLSKQAITKMINRTADLGKGRRSVKGKTEYIYTGFKIQNGAVNRNKVGVINMDKLMNSSSTPKKKIVERIQEIIEVNNEVYVDNIYELMEMEHKKEEIAKAIDYLIEKDERYIEENNNEGKLLIYNHS
ncbi:MAG: phage/plasmid primase, P4 family [Promethearchaeia archaeon]